MRTTKFTNRLKQLRLKSEHKTILIIVFGIIASFLTFEMEAQNVSIGPKLGFSSTTAAGDDVPNETENISGLVGGVFFKVNAGRILAIQPEILFHQKGGYYEESSNINYRLEIDYLEIPLLFKAQIPVGETIYPYVYAGPYAAFTLDNREEGEFFFLEGTGTANLNDFDAGGVFGGGLDIQVGKLFLGLDLRYGVGMVNIYDREDSEDEPDIKNRSFSTMVSLGINL